ncbi:MAG: lysostaphin resistance A-like protein, partial [Gaiellaceae bacterium]
LVGWLIATVALALVSRLDPNPPGRFIDDVINLCCLWVGLVGAVLLAHRIFRATSETEGAAEHRPDTRIAAHRPGSFFLSEIRHDFGVALRPVDLAVGVCAGLAGQYVLTPLLELPLAPFVPHLFTRLSEPANSLTNGVNGVDFVILGLLVCLGSPVVEELYFRGLILRALLGKTARLPRGLAIAGPVVLSGVFFGLVHFEPIELLALSGFGALLALLAWVSGRLGPGFIAHVTFNTATFVTLAFAH